MTLYQQKGKKGKRHGYFMEKGSKSDPKNYRPISLTFIASKVLEHIVHSHIMKYFVRYLN